jgi:hypothetical protein
MALVSYNVVSVILAALRAAHGSEAVEQGVSFYYLCDEVAGTYRGMTIAVPESYWTKHYACRPSRKPCRFWRGKLWSNCLLEDGGLAAERRLLCFSVCFAMGRRIGKNGWQMVGLRCLKERRKAQKKTTPMLAMTAAA